MPNMDKLLNQILPEQSRNELDPIWKSVIDLDYAYGQRKLAPETSKHCSFAIMGEKINGYYRILKAFYRPADISTFFQEKMSVAGQYNYRDTRHKRAAYTKIGVSPNKIRKRRVQSL